eukprot:gene2530-9423_t
MDCSLNGQCSGSSCVCDAGWVGPQCALLNLGLAPPGGAYGYSPNVSSWGAHVIKWTDGQYHMYVSEMWNACGITSWQTNSHVVHATSATVVGPYKYVDTALPPYATCNHVLVNGSGAEKKIYLYHQGRSGPGKGKLINCTTPSSPPNPKEVWRPVTAHKVQSSASPNGPWLSEGGMPPFNCENPSPLLLANGSVALFCHGPGIRISIADRINGAPFTQGRFILTPGAQPRPNTVWEDPSVWLDKRGHWHLLSHVYPTNTSNWNQYAEIVAGHGFSTDGANWTFSAIPPYTAIVNSTDGKSLHYATRERPFLLLSDDAELKPIALFTAVTTPGHPKQAKPLVDYSFTHVQPVKPNSSGSTAI